jgi:hypothetical protein
MARWSEVESDSPEFAARVRERFDAGTNKTIATLRADGSPRISAIEASFENGSLTVGMMPGSVKLRDVRRDNRVALHAPTLEPPADIGEWRGDAKVAGTLVEHDGVFELDVTEVALASVPGNRLRVESWHPGRGYEFAERD